MCCSGHKGSSSWPTVTPQKATSLSGLRWRWPGRRRAIARYGLGRSGWRDDMRHGLAMARSADPRSYATVVTWIYFPGIPIGVLRPDDRAVREIEDALQNAERSGDDLALAVTRVTLALALVHSQPDAERDRGQKLLAEVSEVFCAAATTWPSYRSSTCTWRVRGRGVEIAMAPCRDARRSRASGPRGTAAGVGRSCDWCSGRDAARARRPTLTWSKPRPPSTASGHACRRGLVLRDVQLLRLRALLARAHGDATGYAHFRDRYRDMATSLGLEGHIAWAEAMP